jgi:hypothetical protein
MPLLICLGDIKREKSEGIRRILQPVDHILPVTQAAIGDPGRPKARHAAKFSGWSP